MGIVAIDAVILLPWTLRQIPVTIHSAVNIVFVVSHLRTVALTAQAHYLGEFDSSAIGKFQ